MTFWGNMSQLRTILATETDNDSPGSEELMSQIRENIEALFMLTFDSGVSGTATKDPSGTTETKFFDSGQAFAADAHNGRSLLIKSGAAIGNLYTIDDTLSGATLVLTGDNLYSDGVRSGDSYKILYDIKTNLTGHDHDAINSPVVVLADLQVVEAKLAASSVAVTKLKLSNSAQSATGVGVWPINLLVSYTSFMPLVQSGTYPNVTFYWPTALTPAAGSYIGLQLTVDINQVGVSGYVNQYYVTASGDVFWIFILRDRATKSIERMWASPDHPAYGMNGSAEHPFPPFDKDLKELFVVTLDPNSREFRDLMDEADRLDAEGGIIKAIQRGYDLDDDVSPPWPTKEITLGVEGNPIRAWMNKEEVRLRRGKVRKPDYVRTASLRRRGG